MFSKQSKEELLPGVQDSVGWQKITDLPVEREGFYETSVNILKLRTPLPFEILTNFNHVSWLSSQSKPEVQDRKTTISVALLRDEITLLSNVQFFIDAMPHRLVKC